MQTLADPSLAQKSYEIPRFWGGRLAVILKGHGTMAGDDLRIPMMSISHSDLMPISSERSDAGLSQCETVIDISQEFSLFSWL